MKNTRPAGRRLATALSVASLAVALGTFYQTVDTAPTALSASPFGIGSAPVPLQPTSGNDGPRGDDGGNGDRGRGDDGRGDDGGTPTGDDGTPTGDDGGTPTGDDGTPTGDDGGTPTGDDGMPTGDDGPHLPDLPDLPDFPGGNFNPSPGDFEPGGGGGFPSVTIEPDLPSLDVPQIDLPLTPPAAQPPQLPNRPADVPQVQPEPVPASPAPVSEKPADFVPAPIVNTMPPPPSAPPAVAHVALTSRIGGGTVAFTSILIVLMIGLWYYARRVLIQLPVRKLFGL